MGNILIRHVDVVTLDDAGTILHDVDVAIEGKVIRTIGAAPPGFHADEIIDGTGQVALPGFFNAHCHAPMTFERGWAEDLPLDRWFNERIWVAESALTEEDVYWGAALAACEMIRSGTVAFADHYFYMDRVAEVVERSGLKAALAWCVFGIGAEAEIGPGLEGTLEFVKRWQGRADGRIRTLLGPHSPYVCPPEFLAEIARQAQELGVGLHIHVAESQRQVENSLQQHGQTPVAHLERLGVFDVPCIAAHCIYLTEDDRRILAERGVHVVQCPKTHLKLAMGATPVPDLLARGVNVALGSDGPGSNNSMDMFEVARLAALIQKHELGDATAMPGDTVLRLATRNGAQAMGFEDSGLLAPGHPADLILVDFNRPHLRPRHNLVANLVYTACGADVSHVIVDGRLLLRNGELLTLDEERILAEAERRAFRMVGEDLRIVREYCA